MLWLELPLVAVVTYYYAAFVQIVLHRWFGHEDRIHRVYDIHAHGHHGKYPPERLLTEAWEDSEKHVMWYYAIPFAPVAAAVFWFLGFWPGLVHGAALLFAVWWHIYLHQEYHVRGSWWERFPWFRKKRRLHFIHHCDVHANYAIVEYWMDTLIRTRKD